METCCHKYIYTTALANPYFIHGNTSHLQDLQFISTLTISNNNHSSIQCTHHPPPQSLSRSLGCLARGDCACWCAQRVEMNMQREELERLMFFEQTREKAAADYLRSPTDPDNLTRWGGALLELAHFGQGQDSIDMVDDAVSKLEEALRISPRKHDALWCLGNAYTSQGFLVTETDKANSFFEKAAGCFQQAIDEAPHNELYQKALEMTDKAPSLHQELQKQLASQQVILGGDASSVGPSTGKGGKEKKKDSDLKYDVMGWIVLAIGVIAWVGFAKSSTSLQPPPPL